MPVIRTKTSSNEGRTRFGPRPPRRRALRGSAPGGRPLPARRTPRAPGRWRRLRNEDGGNDEASSSHRFGWAASTKSAHHVLVLDGLHEVGHRIGPDDAPGYDEGDAVAEPLGLLDVVGGQEDGRSGLG